MHSFWSLNKYTSTNMRQKQEISLTAFGIAAVHLYTHTNIEVRDKVCTLSESEYIYTSIGQKQEISLTAPFVTCILT